VLDDPSFGAAAARAIDWACAQQRDRGWIDAMGFTPGADPLTHTIAYTIEGLLECALLLGHERAWTVAVAATEALEAAYRDPGSGARLAGHGGLAATFRTDWTSSARYECVTGSAQVALCARRIHAIEGAPTLLDFGDDLLASVKRAQPLGGPDGVRGGVPGSFPLWGSYGSFKYLNWAAKFASDVLMDRLAGALPRDRFG
jgi:hypothetical protein